MSTTDDSRYYWSFHFKSVENGLCDIPSVININFSQILIIHLENTLEYFPTFNFTVEMFLHFFFFKQSPENIWTVFYIASFHYFMILNYIRNLKFYNNMIFSRLPYPC